MSDHTPAARPVFIISGGAGALGKHMARVALAQFPGAATPVIVIPQIRDLEQLEAAIQQVAERNGVIIHTMVEPHMRAELNRLAEENGIHTIDTIGPTLNSLSGVLGRTPLGQPGLYKGEPNDYLERIQAIEYTVDHDDGRNPHELGLADVVLAGVSRVGKTPLSIYLSVLGWKVANIPLVPNVAPPKQLFEIDRRRVVGLTLDPDVLQLHRRYRQQLYMNLGGSSYIAGEALYDELDNARKVFRKGGFAIIDVTNKPIEESADQIIAHISRYFEHHLRRV